MANKYEVIDESTWERDMHCMVFRKSIEPAFCVTFEADVTEFKKKDNATPLFDWGKYYEKDERVLIPISIQAHHSFVDGIHIGQFVDALQKFFDEY